MEGFNLDTFKSKFGGGARAYLFMYQPTFPDVTVPSNPETKYLVRASNIPESTSEEIIVNWQGADCKFAGKQTFTDWTITFNVDLYAEVRVAFEEWMNLIHNVDGDQKYGTPADYERPQDLYMLDYSGNKSILTVKLIDAWPKSVSAITLDYSSMDVAQFDVTFGYLYHRITKGE